MDKDAQEVFLLMRRDFRVSRNVRALWYFEHLNRTVQIECERSDTDESASLEHLHRDLEVVGAVACAASTRSASEEPEDFDAGSCLYRVRPDTIVTCLSKSYRLVFVLDLSPSAAVAYSVDAKVLYEKLISSFRSSLEAVAKPCQLPGKNRWFRPQLFVTVLAYTPFLVCTGDQVLLHGYPLSMETMPEVIERVRKSLRSFINCVSSSARPVIKSIDRGRRRAREEKENEPITGNLFIQSPAPILNEDNERGRRHQSVSSCVSDGKTPRPGTDEIFDPRRELAALGFVSPEWALLNMLRLGLLGIQLLPENTQANIILVTDGVFGVPDANALQALLIQLRTFTVSCSFLQIQPKLKTNPGFGHTSYPELLHFLSTATFGSYLPDCPCSVSDSSNESHLNLFHRAFLCWSFLTALGDHRHLLGALNPWIGASAKSGFTPLRRRHFATTLDTSLHNALYVRLREGYTLKRVSFMRKSGADQKQMVSIELRLPWKPQVSIEYHIVSEWPTTPGTIPKVKIEVWIEAPYEFLKDVVTEHKQRFRSVYRRSLIGAFFNTIQMLTHADKLLLHLHSFTTRSTFYSLPDSVKNGMPLFYLPPNSEQPVITSKSLEDESPDFCEFWKPVCTLDMSIWQKWLHTHSIRILLTHDVPLSSNLHTASPNTGRYGLVLCRQAATALHDALKDWASFTLMDDHSYVKFEFKDDQLQTPAFFYIIRTCLKPPCLALKVAFLGGIRGAVRQKIMAELCSMLLSLSIKQRPQSVGFLREVRAKRSPSSAMPLASKQIPALSLLVKPIERVLVRYDKVPKDLNKLVRLEEVTNEIQARSAILHNSLARYMCCRRWIWQLRRPSRHCFALGNEAAGYILHALVRRRIQEGFRLAFGSNGIINMARELAMDNGRKCLIQYVVFPPVGATHNEQNRQRTRKDSHSGVESPDLSEAESTEADSDAQLVTELWVEPQEGRFVFPDMPCNRWLTDCVCYKDLHKKILDSDRELIECLATFEHLRIVCESKQKKPLERLPSPPSETPVFGGNSGFARHKQSLDASPVTIISSCFNLVSLLSRCQIASILFSTLSYDGTEPSVVRNRILLEELHRVLSTSQDSFFRPRHLDLLWLLLAEQYEEKWRLPWLRNVVESGVDKSAQLPQLGAYVKRVSDWRLVVLLVPITFDDLKILTGLRTNSSNNVDGPLTLPLFLFHCYEPALAAALAADSFDSTFLGPSITEDFRPTSDSELTNLHTRIKRMTSTTDTRPLSIDTDASELFEFEPDWFFRGRSRVISEQVTTEDQTELDIDFNFPAYCSRIESSVYARSFVFGIYRSLVQGVDVSRDDVLNAIDGRCDEFTLEVDLSNFLPLVCTHFDKYIESVSREGLKRSNTLDSDKSSFSLHSTNSHTICNDPHPAFTTPSCSIERAGLESSFRKLVNKYFRSIPSSNDYYFYYPQSSIRTNETVVEPVPDSDTGEWTRESTKETSEQDLRELEETIQFEATSIEFEAEKRLSFGSSSTLSRSIESALEVITSELSSRSTSDSALQSTGVDCPLFIQLNCSLRLYDRLFTCSIDCLPACLIDILSKNKRSEFELWDFDLRNLEVTLDISVLTLFPCSGPIDLLQQRISSSPESANSADSPSDVRIEHSTTKFNFDFPEDSPVVSPLSELPDSERMALLDIKHGIEFLMTRELVFAYTRQEERRLTPSVLSTVLRHLRNFMREEIDFLLPDSYRPTVEEMNLTFVMREDKCMARFLERLVECEVGYGHIRRLGPYFYVCSVTNLEQFWNLSDFNSDFETELYELGGVAHSTERAHLRPEQFAAPINEFMMEMLNSPIYNSMKTMSENDDDDDIFDSQLESVTPGGSPTRKVDTPGQLERRQSFSGFPSIYCSRRDQNHSSRRTAPPEGSIPVVPAFSIGDFSDLQLDRRNLSGGAAGLRQRNQQRPPPVFENLGRLRSDINSSVATSRMATEEGYEPEDSEIFGTDDQGPNESQDLSNNRQRPLFLRDFWLIAVIDNLQVTLYFFERFPTLHKPMLTKLRDKIKHICKTVNQEILLENLNETRLCNSLLVPDKDEEWSAELKELTNLDDDDHIGNSLAVRAHTHFAPGTFGCPCVWYHWFYCHPRLKSPSTDRHHVQHIHARSLQVLKGLLHKFAVKNRENLFVFVENAGQVFYVKLHESVVSVSSLSFMDPNEKLDNETTEERFHHSVLLTVHGLHKPGQETTVQLRDALQRKLDEAVLDIISMTLSRNPNCRLTPDDVKFMQPDHSNPRSVVRFGLPSFSFTHLFPLGYYLTQHLLDHFMNTPNYMLASGLPKENTVLRFMPYAQTNGQTENNNFFVYVRPPRDGTKGLAIVSQSFVYSNGEVVKGFPGAQLDDSGYNKFFPDNVDCCQMYFVPLTETRMSTGRDATSRRKPDLHCLTEFCIWVRGDIDYDDFIDKLRHCVQQALADLVTEYGLLVEPVIRAPGVDFTSLALESNLPTDGEIGSQKSAFATARGHAIRRSDGHISSDRSLLSRRKRSTSAATLGLIDSHKSNISVQSAKLPTPGQSSTLFNFDFPQVFGKLAPESGARRKTSGEQTADSIPSSPVKKLQQHTPPTKSDSQTKKLTSCNFKLNPKYISTACRWFDHVLALKANLSSAVTRFELQLESTATAGQILYEGSEALKAFLRSTNFSCFASCPDVLSPDGVVYRMIQSDQLLLYGDNRMKECDGRIPEKSSVDLVLVGHSLSLWQETMKLGRDWKSNLSQCRTVCSLFDSAPKSSQQPIAQMQNLLPLLPQEGAGFVPRQRLVIVVVSGTKLSVYAYNWTSEVNGLLNTIFLKLVCWYNARARSLAQICLHKMGLSHFSAASETALLSNPYLAMYWSDVELSVKSILSYKQITRTDYSRLEPQYARLLLKPYRYAENRPVQVAIVGGDVFAQQSAELVELRKYWRDLLQEQLDLNNFYQKCLSSTDEELFVEHKQFNLVVSRSRSVHFVLTPLLFSPSWRKKVAQIRKPLTVVPSHSEIDLPSVLENAKKHSIGSPQKRSENSSRNNSGNSSIRQGAGSPVLPSFTLAAHSDAWHFQLQHLLCNEYITYLKTLGLRIIRIGDGIQQVNFNENDKTRNSYNPFGPAESPSIWLFKCFDGGVVLVKLSFQQPYFAVQYYIWDVAQLHATVRRPLPARSHLNNFKQQWSHLILRSHIHSFSYDFHLKMVAAYLTGGQKIMFRPGYHMNAFLVDFLQYYGCRPGYARNCLYEDRLAFPHLPVNAAALYNHLLDHDQAYSLRVVRMRVPCSSGNAEAESDYLLVSTDHYEHGPDKPYQVLRVVLQDHREYTAPLNSEEQKTLRLKFYVLFVSSRQTTIPMIELDEAQKISREPSGGFRLMETNSSVEEENTAESEDDDELGQERQSWSTFPILTRRHSTAFVKFTPPPPLPRSLSGSIEEHSVIAENVGTPTDDLQTSDRFQVSRVPDVEILSPSPRKFTINVPPLLVESGRGQRLSIQRSAPRRHRKSTYHKHSLSQRTAVSLPDGSVLAREQVTYVTYVSDRQRKLQTALEDWVKDFKRVLTRTVSDAGWHCRRDQLWTKLLESAHSSGQKRARQSTGFWSGATGSPKSDPHVTSVTDLLGKLTSSLSGQDFEALLGYVTRTPANEIDPKLAPFLNNLNHSDAMGFIRTLIIKFGPDRCRYFVSPGTQHKTSKQHLVVLNPNYLDGLALVTVDQREKVLKLALVYKDWETLDSDVNEENRRFKFSSIQSFFEEVVSCLNYYTWTKLTEPLINK